MDDCVTLFNAERARHGLATLIEHPRLVASATAHSADMARAGRMDHSGSDGSSPGTRMKRAGYAYEAEGECVAAGQTTAAEVVKAWLDHPPHRRIVLGDYRHVGVAASGHFWTADFASGMSDPPPTRDDVEPW